MSCSPTLMTTVTEVSITRSFDLLGCGPARSVASTDTTILAMQKGRSAQPVAKAVARLTSVKAYIRQATLAWLEQAGWRQDPEFLCLASHTELLGVVRALRESCSEAHNQHGQVCIPLLEQPLVSLERCKWVQFDGLQEVSRLWYYHL